MSNKKYESAYQYFKSMIKKEKNMSKDALISQVGRMFLIDNIKHFHSYVLQRFKEEDN